MTNSYQFPFRTSFITPVSFDFGRMLYELKDNKERLVYVQKVLAPYMELTRAKINVFCSLLQDKYRPCDVKNLAIGNDESDFSLDETYPRYDSFSVNIEIDGATYFTISYEFNEKDCFSLCAIVSDMGDRDTTTVVNPVTEVVKFKVTPKVTTIEQVNPHTVTKLILHSSFEFNGKQFFCETYSLS